MSNGIQQLLEEMKPHLPEPLWETARGQLGRLQWAELRVAMLEEKLRQQRIAKYGPGSESLSSAQLELLELEPAVSREEVAAEAERAPLEAAAKPAAARRPHPGRQTLPEGLARVVTTIACPQTECAACGGATTVIGFDESERLDVKPAEYFIAATRREKRACAQCADAGVATAPPPVAIIAKGLASDGVVIDVLIAKYSDHCPLFRQSSMLQRDAGIDIGRATLNGWAMQVGESLGPLVECMKREILAGDYIQADETTVGVQTHDGRGKNAQAYLWQYGRPGAGVVFDFRMSRGQEGPRRFLGKFSGVLQTDGYAAYNGCGGEGIVHAVCWTHARRKFYDALQLNPSDATALEVVAAIDRLFALDRAAASGAVDFAARNEARQRHAPGLLDAINGKIQAARASALPASELGKAVRYTLALWFKLTRFLEHPQLELSNNVAENSMRPVALGRKNWIHFGSQQAGPRNAAIMSVVESCRRLDIPLRRYLGAVLPGLADRRLSELPALTPIAWADRNR